VQVDTTVGRVGEAVQSDSRVLVLTGGHDADLVFALELGEDDAGAVEEVVNG
jgi:hypothetical protein